MQNEVTSHAIEISSSSNQGANIFTFDSFIGYFLRVCRWLHSPLLSEIEENIPDPYTAAPSPTLEDLSFLFSLSFMPELSMASRTGDADARIAP
jgi:hypothetical protein